MTRAAPSRARLPRTVILLFALARAVVATDAREARAPTTGARAREIDDYHYVFSADCQPYMTWQARALYDSWKRIGSPGRITRVLSCTAEEYATYEHFDVVPDTERAPSFVWYAKETEGDEDGYAAYNLPGGMDHWARTRGTDRKWVVKLDADMILLKPLTTRELPASKGVAASGQYDYLVGTTNGMAKWFVDEETEKRLARVGGWEIFDAEDFINMTPKWLEYTKRVRMDKRVWYPYRGTGDVYISEKNPRPWISEMYGFIFGCAVAGLRHNVMPSTQLYAGYVPWDEASEDPYIIHYGITMNDGSGYKWDKHWEDGHLERMTCATKSVKPFPVVPYPSDPGPSASTQERRRFIKLKIMYITVSSINESVKKYNDERCSRVTRVVPRAGPKSLPELEQPKEEAASARMDNPVREARREEHKRATEAMVSARRLERKFEHEDRMRKLWTLGSLSWMVGLSFVAYRVFRRGQKRSYERRKLEKNPFRTV